MIFNEYGKFKRVSNSFIEIINIHRFLSKISQYKHK